jgi:hypothetical protein
LRFRTVGTSACYVLARADRGRRNCLPWGEGQGVSRLQGRRWDLSYVKKIFWRSKAEPAPSGWREMMGNQN